MATNIYEKINIPKTDIESFVHCFLPDLIEYFKTDEAQKEYEEWEKLNGYKYD